MDSDHNMTCISLHSLFEETRLICQDNDNTGEVLESIERLLSVAVSVAGDVDADEELTGYAQSSMSSLLKNEMKKNEHASPGLVSDGTNRTLFPKSPGDLIVEDISPAVTPDKLDNRSNFSWNPSLEKLLPTTRNFHLETQMCVTCSQCGYISTKRSEFFRELSLDLESTVVHSGEDNTSNKENGIAPVFSRQKPLTLETLLNAYFAEQQRDFKCDACHAANRTIFKAEDNMGSSNSRALVTSKLHTLPRTFVIHLKRFDNNLLKVATPVNFPTELVIEPEICTADCTLPSVANNLDERGRWDEILHSCASHEEEDTTNSNVKKNNRFLSREVHGRCVYKLSAVVRHMGDDAKKGHYVTDLPDNDYKSSLDESSIEASKWRRCDDSMIHPIDLRKVLEEKDTPYLLFYTFNVLEKL